MKIKYFALSAVSAALIIMVACGKKNEDSGPPPAAANPNPVFTGAGGTIPGTSCPMPQGMVPLRSDASPFNITLVGPLQNQMGGYGGGGYGSGSNTRNTLIMGAALRNNNFYIQDQEMVAGAQFTFPDIYQLIPQSYGANISTTICVQSVNLQNSSIASGTHNLTNKTVNITMRGLVSVPYTSPFGGAPSYGNAPMGQDVLEVVLGRSCPVVFQVQNQRLSGCVDVSLGNSRMAPLMFRMQ